MDEARGTVIRGYRSRLDGSIQPYALTLPADWKRAGDVARRLDVVLLGRGEKRSELAFLAERERPPGANEIRPPAALVLTPYGRYCNATKFAGEVDVFEALGAVRGAYRVDPDRIVLRGFSMGGASTWHLATHFPDRWVAASPGAGFAETAAYAKVFAPASRRARTGKRPSGAGMMQPDTPRTCSTCQPSRTAARSIRRSRPPTS